VNSPSHQICELQSRAAELVVEPDAEVVQSYPRRQSGTQTLDLMGTLPPEAEGVEEFVINRLDDLTYPGNPPPQRLGPGLFGVALGRMDHLRPVAIEPAAMVFSAFEAFVGHISSREGRAHADESGVRIGPEVEERLRQWLVGRGGSTEAKARDHSGGLNGGQKEEALLPAQAVGPADVGISGKPAIPTTLRIPDGHGRGVQGLIEELIALHDPSQMQGYFLDGVRMEAHQPVKLRAVGQGGERTSQMALGVAVEVSLAGESRPAGEDGERDDLAFGKGGLGAWSSLLGAVGLAEVIDDDVECGEEGVHIEHGSVPFPTGLGGKPTLRRGHLPLKSSPPNSHQAFKMSDFPYSTGSAGSVRYINPDSLIKNPAFTNLVVVEGNVKTVHIGGQDAVNASGEIVGKGDIVAQVEQTLANVRAALAAGGAGPEHIIKWNIYVVEGQSVQAGFDAFQNAWPEVPNAPAITVVFVSALAHPDFLVEMDAVAVVPQ
jgi:enamine deaminase RidA (YjgF/YER057c/UK114 family)